MDRLNRANVSLAAAGVAFFGVFALFPAMAAVIALFGLLADPGVVEAQFALLADVIPEAPYSLIDGQLDALLATTSDTLGWATGLSILIALWSTRAGVSALISGLNAVYGRGTRSGLRHVAAALALTVTLVFVAIAALLAVVILPVVLSLLPVGTITAWVIEALRWLFLVGVLVLALGIIYRFGPAQTREAGDWVSPGALLVVPLWLVASAGFSAYLTNFGSYNEVYGSLGAAVALLMWLYISAALVLAGAALNAELSNFESAAVPPRSEV
jgi:membrane protein